MQTFSYVNRLLLRGLGVCEISLNFIINFLQLTVCTVIKSNSWQNNKSTIIWFEIITYSIQVIVSKGKVLCMTSLPITRPPYTCELPKLTITHLRFQIHLIWLFWIELYETFMKARKTFLWMLLVNVIGAFLRHCCDIRNNYFRQKQILL